MRDVIDLDELERLAGGAEAQLWQGAEPVKPYVAEGRMRDWKWPYRSTLLSDETARFVSRCDPASVAALVRAVRAALEFEKLRYATPTLLEALEPFRKQPD